ncbi:unnamed protein product [Adineta steineri]|uniref:Uncharacterized protein n=1 Tax=Adineta steineri TaxID=433720 RepID=A0A818JLK0_9BILA|nr:unnamed protein product [Adineta steineri]CAF3540599.1 unnamed protein product [Adineta steineri]CAF3690541.1 unnamed protein product [Adineta steineri]
MSNELSHDTINLTRLRWRFVICAASFYVNVITWGFISSTGIFEDSFRTTYELSSFKSTLPGSIQIATMSILSVFASILTIKYGVRWTTISGAFISSIGSILAAIIGDYWAFCLFYGFLVGTGETLMLVPAVLAIPPYFHSSRVSLATACAVSGASIGMLGIPFLLQYLLDKYGLRGATLLGSCLWLSVGLAGALFGKGVTSIEEGEENNERFSNESFDVKIENEREHPTVTQHRPHESNNRLIYSRRTSILPTSTHYYQHKRLSSLYPQHHNKDQLIVNTPTEDRSKSSLNSSPIIIKSHTFQSLNTNTHLIVPHNDHNRLSILADTHTTDNIIYKQINISEQQSQVQSNLSENHKYFIHEMITKIYSLFSINTFRILIISIILIWSLDETNFLFLTDLLKSSGHSEQKSTLLIAIIGIADLIGQLFFGYLGDVEYLNPFILWTCTSIIAGLALSVTPLIGSYNIIGLCIVFAIHAFFLAAPNILGNIIMIEVVGMHRYAIAYGFSLLVSGLTSLFGYPLLGLLKDKTHSWTIPFALVGSIMICGGLVAGIIPLYNCYKKQRTNSNY